MDMQIAFEQFAAGLAALWARMSAPAMPDEPLPQPDVSEADAETVSTYFGDLA